MIEGKELVGPRGFKPPWGRLVHYCNLYVKVAENYIDSFLNLFKYILYILIENENIGLKKKKTNKKPHKPTFAASVHVIPGNTTAWEGQALGILGQEAESGIGKAGRAAQCKGERLLPPAQAGGAGMARN